MLVRNQITYILKPATQSILLSFCLKSILHFQVWIGFRAVLFFQMLLLCALKILEKSVREGFVCVGEEEWVLETKRLVCRERWIRAPCHCVRNTTCPLLVSSDPSWDRSTQRLEGILHKRSFICAYYMCYCTTWISVLCIFLTHREVDVIKLHSDNNMIVALYIVVFLFQVSWLYHTLTTVRWFEWLRAAVPEWVLKWWGHPALDDVIGLWTFSHQLTFNFSLACHICTRKTW